MAEARAVWFFGGRSQSHMKRSENGDRLCFDTRLSRKANQQESGNWTGEFYVSHHTALFISAAAQHPKKKHTCEATAENGSDDDRAPWCPKKEIRKRHQPATRRQSARRPVPHRDSVGRRDLSPTFFMEIVYKTPAFLHVGETGLKFPGDFYILRKFPSRRLPSVVRMDSGWNWTPWMGRSLCWRPMISPSAVSAVISRQSGKVSRFTIREW